MSYPSMNPGYSLLSGCTPRATVRRRDRIASHGILSRRQRGYAESGFGREGNREVVRLTEAGEDAWKEAVLSSTSQTAQEVTRQTVPNVPDAKKLLLQLRSAFQTLPATKREQLKNALRESIAMLEMEQQMPGSGREPSLIV